MSKMLNLLHDLRHSNELPYEVITYDSESDAEATQRARQFYAHVHLNVKGDVDESSIADDGTFKSDLYYDRSDYKSLVSRERPDDFLATGRAIRVAEGEGVDSLPLHIEELPEDWQKYLRGLDPTKLREISALARKENTGPLPALFVIRGMLRDSAPEGIIWLGGLVPEVYASYKKLFGDALVRMGDGFVHSGDDSPPLVPFMVDTRVGLEQMAETRVKGVGAKIARRAILAFMYEGSETKKKAHLEKLRVVASHLKVRLGRTASHAVTPLINEERQNVLQTYNHELKKAA